MPLNSNLPTFTWVQWDGVIVTIDGKSHPIKDGNTNHKYIYWSRQYPNQFKTTQVLPEQNINTFLVLVNKNGVAEVVPQKELSVNWYGQLEFDTSSINGAIGGIQDQIDDLDGKTTTRFVGIETDITGIKNRVSKVEETTTETNKQVADLWIKSDQIGSKVEETITKLDGTNKDLNDFKNSVNDEFIDVATGLGNFNDYIHDAFKDNVISESEAILIKEHLVTLDGEKLDVIKRVDYLLENPAVIDPERALLIKSKDEYNNAHKSLCDAINVAIADGKIVPSERTTVTTAFAQYSLKLSNLKAAIQKVTDIGVVERIEDAKSEVLQTAHEITSTVSKKVDALEGTVNEELSQIKQTSNSINLRVTSIEKDYSTNAAMQQAVADAKSEILEQVTDIGSVVDAVQDYIDNAFKDKLLDETFISKLNDLKGELSREKLDIDDITKKTYENVFLSEMIKNDLNGKKTIFNTCYDSLVGAIDLIVADGSITIEEEKDFNLKTQEYSFAIVELNKVLNVAVDDISTNKMNDAKSHTETQVEEVSNALNGLGTYIEGAFKDGVLDEAEKISLKEKLDTLTLEKKDIDEQVKQIVLNANLSTSVKNNLNSSKSKYDKAHKDLSDHISLMISKDDLVADDTKLLKTLFDNYVIALGDIKKNIQLAIEDITKQSVDGAKKELTSQIGEVDLALGNLNNYLEDGFKNGIVTEAEKLTIQQQLNSLSVEKKDVDGHYEHIINSSSLKDDVKNRLKIAKSDFDNAHTTLVNTINDMISDSSLTNEERTKFNNDYKIYGDKLKALNTIMQEALEQIPTYLVDVAKRELRGEITDVSNAINGLEENMTGAFKDGVLDEAEALALKEQIKSLDNEAQDLRGRYEELKKNPDLIATEVNRLDSTWTAYNSSHGNLKNKIASICADNIITPEENLSLETFLNDYRLKLKTLGSVFERCVDCIAKKKADDAKGEAITHTNSQVEILKDSISLKVEQAHIEDAINNLEVGSRNYLNDTDFSKEKVLDGWIKWYDSEIRVDDYTFGKELDIDSFIRNKKIFSHRTDVEKSISSGRTYAGFRPIDIDLEKNTTYTLTVWIYLSSNVDKAQIRAYHILNDGSVGSSIKTMQISGYKGAFEKITFTFTTGSESNNVSIRFYNYFKSHLTSSTSNLHIYQPMLSKGNKGKDWNSSADDLSKEVTQAKSEIKVTTDGISLEVSKKVGNNTVISSINQTSESIKINASKINLSGYVTMTNLSTSGQTTIDGGNITTGTIDASKVNIKGTTTKKIVLANDNYCVYDGAETDVNRKIFMGFRSHSATVSVPSIMLGYNGVKPDVDGSIVAGGTYTTYSHYKNIDNPEAVDLSYGALAFKYNSAKNDICTFNMYQDGKIGVQAGTSIHLRANKASMDNAQLVIENDKVYSRKNLSTYGTFYSQGTISTGGSVFATGDSSFDRKVTAGSFNTAGTIYASGNITSDSNIYVGNTLKVPNMYTNRFYFESSSHLAFGKNSYNNNMLNGTHWDWQSHNLVNVYIYPLKIAIPHIEDDLKVLDLNNFDTLGQIKFREITKYNGERQEIIDTTNVTNLSEITSGNDVDLIKIVNLLIKEVQYLKEKNRLGGI